MQKHIRGGLKDWLLIVLSILIFLSALILPFRWAIAERLTQEEEKLLQAWSSGEIIRIHIIANSDSAADQAIKLHVRDSLIEAFGELLTKKGTTGSDEVYEALKQHTAIMQATAQSCARSLGFEGTVTAETGFLLLPEKKYGKVVLPEGRYRALRITLGSGNGRNWWCVLFPQLCLALSETEETDRNLSWSSERIWQNWLVMDN